jgi:hypothetical protein
MRTPVRTPESIKAYQKAYYLANRKRLNEYRTRYYGEHRESIVAKNHVRDAAALATDPAGVRAKRSAMQSRWNRAHPAKRREIQKRWESKNRVVILSQRRERYAKKERKAALLARREEARLLRLELVAAYGGACSCCGECREPFLSLDHIRRDGSKHRRLVGGNQAVYRDLKRRGWPTDGYRLLCMNCNFATRYGARCPHEPSVMLVSAESGSA